MAKFDADIWLIFSWSRTLSEFSKGTPSVSRSARRKTDERTDGLVQVGHEVLESGVVGIRQLVDLLVKPDVPQSVVVESGSLHERSKLVVGEQRIGKLSEPELEGRCDDVDVRVGVVFEVDRNDVCRS